MWPCVIVRPLSQTFYRNRQVLNLNADMHISLKELNPILPKPPSKNDTTKKEAFSFIRNSKLILKTKEEFREQDQSKTGGSKSFYYTAQLACYATYRPPALMKLHPAFCSISSCCLYWTSARALV